MVYMLLGNGFEETEAVAPLDILRRAGIPVMTVGINGKTFVFGKGLRPAHTIGNGVPAGVKFIIGIQITVE